MISSDFLVLFIDFLKFKLLLFYLVTGATTLFENWEIIYLTKITKTRTSMKVFKVLQQSYSITTDPIVYFFIFFYMTKWIFPCNLDVNYSTLSASKELAPYLVIVSGKDPRSKKLKSVKQIQSH